MSDAEKAMDELLKLYDWYIRFTAPDRNGNVDEYIAGYADGIGKCILSIGVPFGCREWSVKKQKFVTGYKYEAYKRVMEYDTTPNYWKKYPKPLADYFPAEVIRDNGGKL